MKRYFPGFALIILFCGAAHSASAQNTISGLVFDRNRNAVANIDVELLDEYERYVRSVKTSTSGLYIFQSLRAGVYYVQVRVDGTNFKPVKERIQLGQTNFTNLTTGGTSGAESAQINFVLETVRRGSENNLPLNNEIVFAQEVTKEAETFYNDALGDLHKKNRTAAISNLENAIKAFPDYFLALNKLGYEFIELKRFADAQDVFTRAVKVNPKSFSSNSGLGIALFMQHKPAEAARRIEAAVIINPASAASFLFLGKIYRSLKEFEKAEKSLKTSLKLSDSNSADVHWELALLYYYDLKRYNEAANQLELYLKTNPKAENKKQVEKLIKTFREKAGKTS